LRCCSSGPWQVKQFSDRMGRICRLKSIAATVGIGDGLCAVAGNASSAAPPAKRAAVPIQRSGCVSAVPGMAILIGVRSFWFIVPATGVGFNTANAKSPRAKARGHVGWRFMQNRLIAGVVVVHPLLALVGRKQPRK